MEIELRNFMIIWLLVLLSLCYCYAIARKISTGFKRLLFVFPIIGLFVYLPFHLYSFHPNSLTFFSIAFLGNSKLLLFAFGKGPLSSYPSLSLAVFLAVASLPIKLRDNPPPNGQNKEHPSSLTGSPLLLYAIKAPVLAMVVYITTNYWEYIDPMILVGFTCIQFYLLVEMALTLISAFAGALLGLELEPGFNEPYLSTSLQNFWGRRWNLMASNVLRLTVHQPAKKMFSRVFGSRWATPSAVLATFLVSGLIHELMFYHLVRVKPTGEMTCFFLLHGMCVAVEIELDKKTKKKKWYSPIPWLMSVLFTLGFVLVSSGWLFFAPLKRYKAYDRALDEYRTVAALFENAMLLHFGFNIFESDIVQYNSNI